MANKTVWEVLRGRYPVEAFSLMAEVSDATGFARSRSADFVVVGLWPSRGLTIQGIELKSFRGDWLNELKNPKKQENVFKYCDFFWLLTSDEHVAKIEEIPINWGWMVIANDKIKIKKEAPKLEPLPVSRHFMCAMLKRASDKTAYVLSSSIKDKIDEAYKKGMDERDRTNSQKVKQHDELLKIINYFEEESGIKLNSRRLWDAYDAKKVGAAVKFICDGGIESLQKELVQLKHKSDHINKRINETLDIVEQINISENETSSHSNTN